MFGEHRCTCIPGTAHFAYAYLFLSIDTKREDGGRKGELLPVGLIRSGSLVMGIYNDITPEGVQALPPGSLCLDYVVYLSQCRAGLVRVRPGSIYPCIVPVYANPSSSYLPQTPCHLSALRTHHAANGGPYSETQLSAPSSMKRPP